MDSRREFLRRTVAATLTGWGLPWIFAEPELRAEVRRASVSKHFLVDRVRRVTMKIPFRTIPQRAMQRELPHWNYAELLELTLNSGHIGYGDRLIYYAWGQSDEASVKRAVGANAVRLMWDDTLGPPLQVALFDAVSRALEVPIHRLLGRKVRDRTPLSWWNIEMTPADMAAECLKAYRSGYLSYKTKGRPWFDVQAQAEAAAKVVPETFKINMDFNGTLLDAKRGIPILKQLDRIPQIEMYESPINQEDIPGNKAIRAAARGLVAMHYGGPAPKVAVREGVCDGWVIGGGGASQIIKMGNFAGEVAMPFFLQQVGTGITAAFSLHCGGVLDHARWGAVNCHQLFQHSLLSEPIVVEEGFAKIPDKPGLGYEIDRDKVEQYRAQKPQSLPDPPRLVEISWPNGKKMLLGNDGSVPFLTLLALREAIPYYKRGAMTRLVANDGSERWRELYERARKKPFIVK